MWACFFFAPPLWGCVRGWWVGRAGMGRQIDGVVRGRWVCMHACVRKYLGCVARVVGCGWMDGWLEGVGCRESFCFVSLGPVVVVVVEDLYQRARIDLPAYLPTSIPAWEMQNLEAF
ncbi:hypothetical protein BC567DRAFT_34494 [Phyllosticta citribraziliensis]